MTAAWTVLSGGAGAEPSALPVSANAGLEVVGGIAAGWGDGPFEYACRLELGTGRDEDGGRDGFVLFEILVQTFRTSLWDLVLEGNVGRYQLEQGGLGKHE